MSPQRWYPKGKPPSGAELYRLLGEEIHPADCTPTGMLVDFTDGGKDAVGSLNWLERKNLWLEQELTRELATVKAQRNAAHELITRSANLYLRYFVYRHKFLLWWRRVRGPR